MKKKWGHNELAHDLAEHLRANTKIMAWEDMQLGPSGSPRPDVYTVPKSFARFCPRAYEVKVSKSDFRSDVTQGKWQSYLKYACAVTFAVPKGLITKADLPPGCGLIVRNDEGWHTLKAPTLGTIETLPHEAWIKLLIDGIPREARRIERGHPRCKPVPSSWMAEQRLSEKHGKDVARLVAMALRSKEAIQSETERRKQVAEGLKAGTDKEIALAVQRVERENRWLQDGYHYLCEAVGLPPDAPAITLKQKMYEAAARLDRDTEVSSLRRALVGIRSELNKALASLPEPIDG